MNVALSRTGGWLLRGFFAVVVVFLYAPIAILVIFSFNDSQLPTFPLSGFTFHWYHQFLADADLRSALAASAIVAAISSLGACCSAWLPRSRSSGVASRRKGRSRRCC